MRYLNFIFLVLVSALAFKASAQSLELAFQDQQVYLETKKICQNSRSLAQSLLNENTLDAFLISTGQSLSVIFGDGSNSNNIQKYSGQNLLSDYTWDRLNSEGFYKAVQECFPKDQKMQNAFVLSMLTADTAGKIPSIITMIYTVRSSSYLWAKLAIKFPRLALLLKWALPFSAVVYTVFEVRSQIKNRELNEYEIERVNKIITGMRGNTEAIKSVVLDLAQDEIIELEKDLNQASTEKEKAKIRFHIQKIKNAMQKV